MIPNSFNVYEVFAFLMYARQELKRFCVDAVLVVALEPV